MCACADLQVDADTYVEDLPFLLTRASLMASPSKTPAKQIYKSAANSLQTVMF